MNLKRYRFVCFFVGLLVLLINFGSTWAAENTIVHEMVHIGIEKSIIQKYKLPHWAKDRIVDQFMIKHYRDIFPNYQLNVRGNKAIDPYLQHPDSWERLPDYITEYAQKAKEFMK